MARRFVLLLVLLIPACAGAILGDLNRDGQVDFDDFFLFSDHFGEKGPPDPPDTVVVVRVDTLRQVVRDTVVVEMVRIEPGTFTNTMGGDGALQSAPHQVTLTKEYYLGKYEITQEQWKAVMGTEPGVMNFPLCREAELIRFLFRMDRGGECFLPLGKSGFAKLFFHPGTHGMYWYGLQGAPDHFLGRL